MLCFSMAWDPNSSNSLAICLGCEARGAKYSTKIVVAIAWGTKYSTKIMVAIAWGTKY